MKLSVAFALLLLVTAGVSAQESGPAALPAWLRAKIVEFEKLPPFSPPRSILRTQHEGKTVYDVSPACSDIPSELYDEAGALMCYPGGGFAGGDGKYASFSLGSSALATVWRDARSPASSPSSPPGRQR